jgi:uncharacterized membrane protein YgcG
VFLIFGTSLTAVDACGVEIFDEKLLQPIWQTQLTMYLRLQKQDIMDILETAHSRSSSPRPPGRAVAIEVPPRSSSDGVPSMNPKRASSGKKKVRRSSKPKEPRGLTSDDDASDLEGSGVASPRAGSITLSGNGINKTPVRRTEVASPHHTPDFDRKSSGGVAAGSGSAGATTGGLHGSGGSMGSGGGSGGAVAQVAGLDIETRDRALSFSTLINDPLLSSIPQQMIIPASDLVFGSELGQGSFGVGSCDA